MPRQLSQKTLDLRHRTYIINRLKGMYASFVILSLGYNQPVFTPEQIQTGQNLIKDVLKSLGEEID